MASERAAALLEIAVLIAREAPEDVLFATVAEHVAGRAGSDAASVLRFVGDERAVIVGVWREGGGRGFPVNAELDFNRHNSAAGRVRSTGRPARVDSYEELAGELPLLMRASELRSSVMAPVIVGDDVWGAVVASSTREAALPANCEHELTDIAELVALAVANAEARREAAAATQRLVEAADERRRDLERQLHEGVQQHLLALTLKLRLARGRAGEASEVVALIDDALAEADVANTALRELARALYPKVLSERGLAVAVQGLTPRAGVAVHLRELPRRRFGALLEASAYFLIADTLAAVRAHASQVAITVGDRGDHLFVEVAHDAPSGGPPGIAERVTAVGGRLQVGSLPDGGTVVRAEFPTG